MNPPKTIQTFTLTRDQLIGLSKLQSRGWTLDFQNLQHLPAERAIAIRVTGQLTGAEMYFVIEPDGYTHS
jgi:hypothetical protein